MKVEWTDLAGRPQCADWHTSLLSPKLPAHVVAADDTLSADRAFRLVSEGTALVWEGDYQNARQLLSALARRIDKRRTAKKVTRPPEPGAARFHAHRLAQATRARTLGLLWVVLEDDGNIALKRSPDIRHAWREAGGHQTTGRVVVSLRELLGITGAAQWRQKGVDVPALGEGARIHPYYGVFAPTRGEYIDLLAAAPWPEVTSAWDIGTGTGVLAALLAKRGAVHVTATDVSDVALMCARDNIQRLGWASRVKVLQADLFPDGRADLIVCNPPWLPGKPTSILEYAVYDPASSMLRGFLNGVATRLTDDGQAWLVMSDLAERLCLRHADDLSGWIAAGGLKVIGVDACRPTHGKATEADDPLFDARSGERISLWRLARA